MAIRDLADGGAGSPAPDGAPATADMPATDRASDRGHHRRLLLRSPKDPFEVVSPEQVFQRNLVGTNAGNLIFLQSTWKILGVPGATIAPDGLHAAPGLADEINERYDAYVIPLANALRLSYEDTLIGLTQLIRRLRIPVVILGIGAQTGPDGDPARLKPMERSVRAFMSAVLDHGPSIGVRGEYTFDYLRGLGFGDVEVIGCPSMFLWGPDLHVEKKAPRLERDSPISMNVTPYVAAMGPIVAHHMERYSGLTYIAQDLETLGRLLFGESRAGASGPEAVPEHLSHPLFGQDRVRFYVEPWPWIDDLRTADFAFGTRIHGNIAAVLAGTPAFVLAHDSRTLELARYLAIPHRPIEEAGPDIDAAELYDAADYSSLNEGHPARFAAFQAYLRRHGLADVFSDGDGGQAFDERVARTAFPSAVHVAHPGRLQATLGRARHGVHRAVRAGPVRRVRLSARRRLAGSSTRELRPTRPRARARPRRRLGLALGIVIPVVLATAYLGFSAVAWARVTAVNSTCVEERPGQTPANFVATWRIGRGPTIDATPYRFAAEDVGFESLTPGLHLRAWWRPPADGSGRVVIVVHGRGSCRRDAVTLLPAGMLVRHGFGVLVLDLRDHGESDIEDGHWSGGVDEWQDVLGAWHWLRDKGYPAGSIGLYGGSMGAGSVAYAMGHEPAVAAGFLDSPYADILTATTAYAEAHDTPAWVVPGALFMGGLISGDDFLGDSPARIFREKLGGRPVFIVHGDADGTIPVDQGRALAKAATDGGSPVDPWILPGAEHVQAAFLQPEAYERRLADFFAGALGGA